ncbi:MAG: hypothetical protein ACE5GF_06510 [Thermodesulfobacteriota bacterium]
MMLQRKYRTSRYLLTGWLCLSLLSFTLYASSCFTHQAHPSDSDSSHHDNNSVHGDGHHHDTGHHHDKTVHTCICKCANLLNSSVVKSTPAIVKAPFVPLPLSVAQEVLSIATTYHSPGHIRAPPHMSHQ